LPSQLGEAPFHISARAPYFKRINREAGAARVRCVGLTVAAYKSAETSELVGQEKGRDFLTGY
jgi:hypothetical protein